MDDQFTTEVKAKMLKVLDITKTDLATIRTGRAAPALVENVEIVAYGGAQKLKVKELATITTQDSRMLVIHPFDPNTQDEIVKGILEANVGLTPSPDGTNIRISIPLLSQERRQEYIKLTKTKVEAGRVMIRQVRHEEMNDLRASFTAKEVIEDEKKQYEKMIQEITDEMIAELDHLADLKEKELMQI